MIVKFFGYPVMLSASSDIKSLNVSFTTLSAIIFGVKEMMASYSRQGKIAAIVRKFPLIPNPSFLEMHGYNVVNFAIPSDGEHFLNSSTMAIEIKKSGVNCVEPQWILEIKKIPAELNSKHSVKIEQTNVLPNGDKIDI